MKIHPTENELCQEDFYSSPNTHNQLRVSEIGSEWHMRSNTELHTSF